MNRASSSRDAPVNRFDFSAPVPSPLQAPRFIQSNSIPITQPDSSEKNKNSTHGNRHRFSKSQRAPRRQGLSMTQEVLPYGRKPPKPPREESTSPRMSARSRRRNFGPPTESRRGLAAAQPIREYMIHFDKLVSMTEEYMRTNPTYGSYVKDVKALKDAYDYFVLQGSLHFSTSNPDEDPRPTIKTTPIYKSAKNLLTAWAKYIESTNAIESEGLAPYLERINDNFNQINATIKNMRRAMPNIRYRTDVSCVSLESFQNLVITLREEVTEQFLAPKEIRFKEFDQARFQQQITFLTRQIFEIYAHSLPNSCLPLAKKIQTRTELSTAIANISTSVMSARKCDAVFNSMKGEIILANQRLTSIFQRMNFPFSVSLIFDDDKNNQDDQEKKNNVHSFKLQANENVDENDQQPTNNGNNEEAVNNESNAHAGADINNNQNANNEEAPNNEVVQNNEENQNNEESPNNEDVQNNEEAPNNEVVQNNEENQNNEEAPNNEDVQNNEESPNNEIAQNNEENQNNEESLNNEVVQNNEEAQNNEESPNNEIVQNNEEIPNNGETTNNEEAQNNEEIVNNEEAPNSEEAPNNDNVQNNEEAPNNDVGQDNEENQNNEETPNNGETANSEETQNNDGAPNIEETPNSEESPNNEVVQYNEEITNNGETPSNEEAASSGEIPNNEDAQNNEETPNNEENANNN